MRLKPGELSAAVRTPFGWHLIQVQERRTQDITKEKAREQARQALRQRKSEEAFQEWVRQTARPVVRRDPRGRALGPAGRSVRAQSGVTGAARARRLTRNT